MGGVKNHLKKLKCKKKALQINIMCAKMPLSFRKEYFEKGGSTKDEKFDKIVNLIHNNKNTGR